MQAFPGHLNPHTCSPSDIRAVFTSPRGRLALSVFRVPAFPQVDSFALGPFQAGVCVYIYNLQCLTVEWRARVKIICLAHVLFSCFCSLWTMSSSLYQLSVSLQ